MSTECIMKTPESSSNRSVQDCTSLHILINILEDDIMPSWQRDQGANTSHNGSKNLYRTFQGNHDAVRLPNTPRRRSMAIHDMLNPVEGESSMSNRYRAAHPHLESDEGSRMSTSPNLNGSSGRPSPNQSSPSPIRSTPSPNQLGSNPNRLNRTHRHMSSRSSAARAPRQFRPPYSDEEVHFIWYHRIDLGYEWSDITRAYNAQFPLRQREGFGGIQCKYYRLRDAYNIPRVRHRNRSTSPAETYGMRTTTGLSYPWMRDQMAES